MKKSLSIKVDSHHCLAIPRIRNSGVRLPSPAGTRRCAVSILRSLKTTSEFWRTIPTRSPKTIHYNYLMTIFRPLPTAAADSLPPVHAQVLAPETPAEKEMRLARQKNAKDSLIKSWHCCKTNSRPTYRSMQRIPVADGASGCGPRRQEVGLENDLLAENEIVVHVLEFTRLGLVIKDLTSATYTLGNVADIWRRHRSDKEFFCFNAMGKPHLSRS
ncbi:hypothetical protein E4U15_001887 [Claviceps sp. LM218 group G6]|nr:hypothetical protein E4U15_001887 [Claviceps sp. LM218 group G6]